MAARDWTTIQLVHREGPDRFRSRNPFPPGGVVEDPATGAAAAAFGGYLRELGARRRRPPRSRSTRASSSAARACSTVTIPADGGISVAGTAVPI